MMVDKENVPLNLSVKQRLENSTGVKKASAKGEVAKPKLSRKETYLSTWLNTCLSKDEKFNYSMLGAKGPESEEYTAKDATQMVLSSIRVASGSKAIDREVQDGGLILRADCSLHVDLVSQDCLMRILECYEEEWLALGLEAVMGEPIPSKNGHSANKNIRNFVVDKILSGKTRMLKEGMIKKAHRHLLKKILQLILFLDVARESMVLPKLCLFTKTATCKSSKDVAVEFCKNFLQGEGDIIRHLGVLGVKLNFEQTYVHEFDYTVMDIRSDLKDGVRLARLLELLSGSRGLCTALRVPPVSRLQKLHNVGICLAKVFTPTEDQPDAKYIVEGNMEKTIVLLTRIINVYDPDTAGKKHAEQ